MKLAVLTIAVAGAAAYTPTPNVAPNRWASKTSTSSRRDFGAAFGAAVAAAAVVPAPALAANYFGEKYSYSETIDPKVRLRRRSTAPRLASDPPPSPQAAVIEGDVGAVSGDLTKVKGWADTARKFAAAVEASPQADVGADVKKAFPLGKMRLSLNTVASVFDEDTQRGTDRLIRNVLQDVAEALDAAAFKTKDGATYARSERKVSVLKRKLAELADDLDEIVKFFP